MGESERFFLSQDDSCHWYIVRAEHRSEWDAWVDQLGGDDPDFDTPDYAQRIGGSPSVVTFERPSDG